jgi:hypothetical protein
LRTSSGVTKASFSAAPLASTAAGVDAVDAWSVPAWDRDRKSDADDWVEPELPDRREWPEAMELPERIEWPEMLSPASKELMKIPERCEKTKSPSRFSEDREEDFWEDFGGKKA